MVVVIRKACPPESDLSSTFRNPDIYQGKLGNQASKLPSYQGVLHIGVKNKSKDVLQQMRAEEKTSRAWHQNVTKQVVGAGPIHAWRPRLDTTAEDTSMRSGSWYRNYKRCLDSSEASSDYGSQNSRVLVLAHKVQAFCSMCSLLITALILFARGW
ncbi:hypothetical protein LZ30DRAFT_738710 [Colletotrichum cereale]|nr:hypothetical protein LZ30DRAFT_738710 [Colletotrichum cereale]